MSFKVFTKLPRTLEVIGQGRARNHKVIGQGRARNHKVIGQGRARNHKPDVCGFPHPFQVKARILI